MATSVIAGKTALVTGASSGLGVDFAAELAALGCKLVLVARREDRLKQVQQTLRERHGVEVIAVTLDLMEPDAPKALHDLLRQQNVQVDILINNAGCGIYGRDLEIPWARTRNMLQLDILALTQLTRLFAAGMVARKSGYILQVASMAGFQPTPGYAAYAAAKAYVLNYGHALNAELAGSGVSCTVLSPGFTETEFLAVAGHPAGIQAGSTMSSAAVARAGVRAMLARRAGVVPGWANRLGALLAWLVPRPWQARLIARLMLA